MERENVLTKAPDVEYDSVDPIESLGVHKAPRTFEVSPSAVSVING
jgi:hypothetical protein